jgi:Circularly permutated YpsA SLOG family
MSRLVIISGGQTGVDRGALDAALAARAPCGGWCPEGREAEDGPIPARYPVHEIPGGGYIRRTRQNVEDSDGTLVLTFGPATGGTARTIEFCHELRKPHLIIDADKTSLEDAERLTLDFVRTHEVAYLNVAGPRASMEGRGYWYARGLVGSLLQPESGPADCDSDAGRQHRS